MPANYYDSDISDPIARFGAATIKFPENLSRQGIPYVVFGAYQRDRAISASGSTTTSILASIQSPLRVIALPLPSSALSTKYGVQYRDASIGAGVGSAAVGAKNALGSLNFSSIQSALSGAGDALSAGVSTVLSQVGLAAFGALGAIPEIGSQLKDVVSAKMQATTNPFTEVLFENVPFREHTFTYTFQPKSQEESIKIDSIIQYFKYFMLPKLSGEAGGTVGTWLRFPLEWQIMFSIADTTFTLLPSVLTNMDLNYAEGVDSPKLFKPISAQPGINQLEVGKRYPTKINLSLTFKETVMLTRDYVNVGTRLSGESMFTDLPNGVGARYRF